MVTPVPQGLVAIMMLSGLRLLDILEVRGPFGVVNTGNSFYFVGLMTKFSAGVNSTDFG